MWRPGQDGDGGASGRISGISQTIGSIIGKTAVVEPTALWCVGPGVAERLPGQLGEGVLVETLYSGISRGTERLVFEGRVPPSEYARMRGPSQEGSFPFPVKYGYSAVGQVQEGELADQLVFALFPHQTHFRLPTENLVVVPDDVPAGRAVLAANMETALNIMWDSGVAAGDRVAVVGGGLVGSLVGYLATQIPGTEVSLVDINPARESLATSLGCAFASPDSAPRDCDVVIHTSATESGLGVALDSAGAESTVVEASWHGAGSVSVPLGAAFHSKRLRLISSQVGALPPARAPRWSHHRRLSKALQLLSNPVLDVLISGETDFAEIDSAYAEILADPQTLCHRIRYRTP